MIEKKNKNFKHDLIEWCFFVPESRKYKMKYRKIIK